MRIIVNLDNAADGKRTWSQQFTGVPKEPAAIEDQISAQLVTALAVKLTDEELARSAERPTDNVEAYDLYLRGESGPKGAPIRSRRRSKPTTIYEQSIKQDPRSRWLTPV